jgi:CBS domain containing-hemolysin-like protein
VTALILLQIILLLLLIVASAIFSGSETALFSLGSATLKRWREGGTRSQKLVARLMADHHSTLVVILIGTNFVNILAAVIFNRLTGELLPRPYGPLIAGVLATAIILVFGEVTPKTVAYGNAATLAPRVAPLINALLVIFRLPVTFIRWCSGGLLAKLSPELTSNALTPDEHRMFINIGRDLGVFSEQEARMLAEIVGLRGVSAASIMVPRVDVNTVDRSADAETVQATSEKARHRHIPVVDGDMDQMIGVLDIKAFTLGSRETRETWQTTCVRPPLFVPEIATADKVLAQLAAADEVMAIMVDEYGGISGLITTEDVIEQVVGELLDEFDPPSRDVVQLRPGHWRVSGLIALHDLADVVEVALPDAAADTLGGLIAEQLGQLPVAGDSCELDALQFTVRTVARRRVLEVDVQQRPADEEGEP